MYWTLLFSASGRTISAKTSAQHPHRKKGESNGLDSGFLLIGKGYSPKTFRTPWADLADKKEGAILCPMSTLSP